MTVQKRKMKKKFDVIIIGGGFYGCCLALLLRKHYENILIIEKEADILLRASSVNQARIHSGFHYPRNLLTAFRSFLNLPRFVLDFKKCVYDNFESLYAVARNDSKVNAHQFKKTFENLGIPIKVASSKYRKLFNLEMIEEIFLVQELVFDVMKLREIIRLRLNKEGVTFYCGIECRRIEQAENNQIRVFISNEDVPLLANKVYNCTYSQINKILKESNISFLPLKHEVTEIALIEIPGELDGIGITVMDGPFFSTLPFPSMNLYSLTHVRYTPHYSWADTDGYIDGHRFLKDSDLKSNFPYMIKDAKRYLPVIEKAKYVDSLYEVKTVLTQNEIDDGRPILLRKDYGIKNFSIVMGSKIDNIYDVLDLIVDKTYL